jgi:hypothetical protein
MAFGTFLALRHKDGPGKVYRYNLFGQTNPIGNAFGSAESATASEAIAMCSNRVVQFKGVNDLYTVQGDDIWHFTGEGTTEGDWESVHTFQDPSTGTEQIYRVGPFVMYIGGRPALVCIYYLATGTTNWRAVTSFDGVTWTESQSYAIVQPRVTSPTASSWGEHVFRNVIYWNIIQNGTPQQTRIMFYDPNAQSMGNINTSGLVENGQNQSNAVAIFNGRHYIFGNREASNTTSLWEIQGGSLRLKTEFAQTQQPNSRFCLFSDNTTALYSFSQDNGTTRWTVSKWAFNPVDSSFTHSDITSSVLPAAAHGNTSAYKLYGRWVALYDRESDQIVLAFSDRGNTGGSAWAFYTWNGESTLIGDNGSPQGHGGSAGDALTIDYNRGTGSRNWRETDPHIVVEDRSEVSGGERLEFRLYSWETSVTVDVDLLYNLADGPATTQGTLSNPSAGTLNGNVVEGLTADPDGSTLYEVTWLNSSDGVGKGDPVRRQLRVTRA